MSLLAHGLESLDIGVTNWRLVINANLADVYTTTETTALWALKSDTSHAHPTYWPLPNLITNTDMDPVLSAIITDIAFDSTHNPLLVDRTTGELYRLEVTSAAVTITATGVYVSNNPNTLNNIGDSLNTDAYPSILNGDLI